MKKIMLMAFSLLMTTGVSTFAQAVVKVTKDSTKTIVTNSIKLDPVKTGVKDMKDSSTTIITYSTKAEPVKVAKDSTTTTVTTSTIEPVKTEIKSVDLPKPVKDLGVNFKSQGWDTTEKAYVVKGVSGDVAFYVVTFKNPTTGESKSINIDAKGNIVKE